MRSKPPTFAVKKVTEIFLSRWHVFGVVGTFDGGGVYYIACSRSENDITLVVKGRIKLYSK